MSEKYQARVQQAAQKYLVGAKITGIRWASKEELEGSDFYERPVEIQLDNGEFFAAMQDPEGNGPGALFCSWEDEENLIGPIPMEDGA